jgi:3-deoxy-D-manno-octulosonate 8-phosphate phosphatase (KDO 8-P phosphatase)
MFPEHLIEKAKKIQCLICDVDGVLTNGTIVMDAEGKESRAFHVHDGMGLKFLMASGIHVAIITTSRVPVIDYRMRQLGIQHYYRGQVSKITAYNDLKRKLTLDDEAFAYIGDDLPDWEIMKNVGLSIAVSDAVPSIARLADWKTNKIGGYGAVREVCDALLALNQTEDLALKKYLDTHPTSSEAMQ